MNAMCETRAGTRHGEVIITIEQVPVGSLMDAGPYQRNPADREHWLDRLLCAAGGYDEVLAEMPQAFWRKTGRHCVMDGLGRCAMALRQFGPDHLMTVRVVRFTGQEAPDLRVEQWYFDQANRGKHLTPADRFFGRRDVGFPDETTIDKIFLDAGIELVRSKGNLSLGTYAGLGLIMQAWEAAQSTGQPEQIMRTAVRAVTDSFGEGGFDGAVMVAVVRLLSVPENLGRADIQRLVTKMKKFSPPVIKYKARDQRTGNGAGVRIANFLVIQYNIRLRPADRITGLGPEADWNREVR